jgi:hypothetical protein
MGVNFLPTQGEPRHYCYCYSSSELYDLAQKTPVKRRAPMVFLQVSYLIALFHLLNGIPEEA